MKVYGWEVEKMEQKENLKVVVGAFTIIAIICLLYTEFYFKYLTPRKFYKNFHYKLNQLKKNI